VIWIARAVCIPQVRTIFQQILGAFFALVSLANFLHVHSTKHVWCVTAVRSAFSVGYMFRTLHEAINEGHKLSLLPPPPSPKVGDTCPHDCPCKGITIPVFSISMLHEALVKFIVADDQVSTFTTVWHWNASNSIIVYQCY